MRHLFNEHGICTTDIARNGKEALLLLRNKNKLPHVLLLDLEMPVMDGNKTMKYLSHRFPYLKVIIVSSYHDDEIIKEYLNRGARAFVSKREGPAIVIEAIRNVYSFGFYRNNIEQLCQNPAPKDRHYYKFLFSVREREIICLIAEGKTNLQIAAELCISEKTVQGHLTKMFKKVKVQNRSEFVIYVREAGLHFLSKPFEDKVNPLP